MDKLPTIALGVGSLIGAAMLVKTQLWKTQMQQPQKQPTQEVPLIARENYIHKVPANQLGMKVLYKGLQVEVDIVAVHGLGAIPDISWKERESKSVWLENTEMLPKAVPNSRIMRFGYDSLWLGRDPVRTSVATIANTLLANLREERQDHPDRPLIFVGHCFGGLVIEKVLTTDELEQKEQSTLLSRTAGILFLGTPHAGTVSFTSAGASYTSLLSVIAVNGLDTENSVLKDLESQNHLLGDISRDFLRLCSSERYRDVKIVNFFEQRASKVGKLIGKHDLQEFVVDEYSTTLGSYPTYGLPLDHYTLNKFGSPDDGNFKNVQRQIYEMYIHGKKKRLARLQEQTSPSPSSNQNTPPTGLVQDFTGATISTGAGGSGAGARGGDVGSNNQSTANYDMRYGMFNQVAGNQDIKNNNINSNNRYSTHNDNSYNDNRFYNDSHNVTTYGSGNFTNNGTGNSFNMDTASNEEIKARLAAVKAQVEAKKRRKGQP